MLCRPSDVDLFLECLDAAAARVGATRGEGSDVKSHVRLLGHPDALAAFDDVWLSDRVRRTCQVGEANSAFEVLGAVVGGPATTCDTLLRQRVGALRELHSKLAEVNDPATELTLGRACADVSRVTHLLRASGQLFSAGALEEHDDVIDAFVARSLGGDLPQPACDQAALGVAQGGLGFRRAADLALPACLGSRIAARPFLEHLFAAMRAQGVYVPGALELFDWHTEAALQQLLATLSPDRAASAQALCAQAAAAAVAQLAALQSGARLAPPSAPVGMGRAADLLLGELGAEDPEHPAAAAPHRPHLQRSLAALVDADRMDALVSSAGPAGCSSARRLEELRDPTVSSEWLWALDPAQPDCLEADAYVAALRLRLGAGFAAEPLRCRVCRGTLDVGGSHALCCAPGASTRGHNDVRDEVFDLARLADSTAEKEVLGLLEAAPGLRPADVLTSAASPGWTSALDIGIASPGARHAGVDCTESMRVRKRGVYSRHLGALEAEGVQYRPLVWSCWGREHPDTTAVLTQLARQAARRRGLLCHWPLLRRVRARVGAALARRAAAMLRACLPAAVA